MQENTNNKSIILFGDSLLGRFSTSLVSKLEKAISEYTVYNFATGGLNTKGGVNQAPFIAKTSPDYIVLSFGSNDSAPWKQQIDKETFKQNLISIIESFKGSKIIFFTCPPASENTNNGKFKEFNVLVCEYNKIIKELRNIYNIEVIDSDKVFTEIYSGKDDYHKEDGIHLNADGYDVLIDEIVGIVNKDN